MDETLSYELLRSFTTPVVAITAERDGKLNGMISDAATRASIVPDVPRLMILVHKFNYTHDMILDTGRFVVHALHRGQFELIERLGFESGREREKLADVPYRLGNLGCPILADCWAWFECRVINVMDTGSSTCFLGDVVELGRGPGKEIMTPGYMRANLPEAWREPYLTKLAAAQAWARERSHDIRAVIWKGLAGPEG
jgi:flavin reductase (DIM6/NTAB) family NADH-FMN oxidoreductase RutF